MSQLTRAELEQRCADLMTEGQLLTSRIEQLLQRAKPMEAAQFDRSLARLRQESDENHRHLEEAMEALMALDG